MPPRSKTTPDPDPAAPAADDPAAAGEPDGEQLADEPDTPRAGALVRLDDPDGEPGGPARYAIVVHEGTVPEAKAQGPNSDPPLIVPLGVAMPYEQPLYPAG